MSIITLQVQQITASSLNYAYTYDGVGNRLPSLVTSPIVHNENNELLMYGEMEYTYDANGNMIQKRLGTVAVNYIYNPENRLIKVEDDLTKTVIAEYEYDPFGRRLWKDVGGTRTYFFYADEGLAAEYDANGNEIRSYGYQPDSTWTTNPLWLKQDGQYYWYQNDHLGTPQKLIDKTGIVFWEARYEAFGKATIPVETVTNNLRFPGQYFDAETGLHYNWFRYYEPGNGRYVRMDPIGLAGGNINFYTYVKNNPVNWVDIDGLIIQCSSRNQATLEKMIKELKNNPVMKDMMTYLDEIEQQVITVSDIVYQKGYAIPQADIPCGSSFSGANVSLSITESPVFIQMLCPHMTHASAHASQGSCDGADKTCDPSHKNIEEILLLVALAHELTHVYDAAKDIKGQCAKSSVEREIHAVQVESKVAHSYGIPARGDAIPFPYMNNSGMDFPFNKCFYYLVPQPGTDSKTHPESAWK